MPQLPELGTEMLTSSLRVAVRSELGELLSEKGPFREVLRVEFDNILKAQGPAGLGVGHAPSGTLGRRSNGEVGRGPSRTSVVTTKDGFDGDVSRVMEDPGGESPSREISDVKRKKSDLVFADEIATMTAESIQLERKSSHFQQESRCQWFLKAIEKPYSRCSAISEPKRTGRLARIVCNDDFDVFVCGIILANCVLMGVVTDYEVLNVNKPIPGWILVGDWVFQILYTLELVVKLIVHREYFFINDHWKLNWFDCFLVISGAFSLVADSLFQGSYLRLVRLLKFGKAVRALKVMTALKELRAFVVCIMGSFSSFFWSLVTLCIVFFVFSLMFVQLVSGHIQDVQHSDDVLMGMYGSVARSMLTLLQAATGGEDWVVAFDAICETGSLAGFCFIIFIAFTQLALINIITGIFVESAMSTLTPDRETLALEADRKEHDNARELEHLCVLVDADCSGKLTRDQFEDGLTKGRIPLLLTLLGLQTRHVKELFNTMSQAAEDDDGQVDIKQFVNICMRLKGAATNFDMQRLHAEFVSAQNETKEKLEEQDRRLRELHRISYQISQAIHGNLLGY